MTPLPVLPLMAVRKLVITLRLALARGRAGKVRRLRTGARGRYGLGICIIWVYIILGSPNAVALLKNKFFCALLFAENIGKSILIMF
ncbi:MAG: hypothetical protein [Circoviridae sp.]|nr:MAG: hypothetical protein [Circoviridae sp.]